MEVNLSLPFSEVSELLSWFSLSLDQVVNVYSLGSRYEYEFVWDLIARVYGTFQERSDYDFVIVVNGDGMQD